jgi:hypothetical protein
VYVSYPHISLDFTKSTPDMHEILRYAMADPERSFTFTIGKGNRKNAYTITHWVLNLQPNACVSVSPCLPAHSLPTYVAPMHTLERDEFGIQDWLNSNSGERTGSQMERMVADFSNFLQSVDREQLVGFSNDVANSFNETWRKKNRGGALFITDFDALYRMLAEEKSKKTK